MKRVEDSEGYHHAHRVGGVLRLANMIELKEVYQGWTDKEQKP